MTCPRCRGYSWPAGTVFTILGVRHEPDPCPECRGGRKAGDEPVQTVWQIDAHGLDPAKAAERFAATFWPDGPREVVWVGPGPRFTTVGGVATYRVEFVSSQCVYEIRREE